MALRRGSARVVSVLSVVSAVVFAALACSEPEQTERSSQPVFGGVAGALATAGVGAWPPAGGTAGVVGAAGSFGAAGTLGTAGIGTAGALGTAGSFGTAGTGVPLAGIGGSAGFAGTQGAAGSVGVAGTMGSAGVGGDIDLVSPTPSAGCGNADFPAAGTKNADVDGTQRSYIVALPSGYDPAKPYRLVFAWHYLNGTASGIASGGYYGLQSRADDSAIFVAPQGISNAWPNTNGRDVAFTQVLLDFMRSNYCVDESRIFSVGFSYGAIMSNRVGCAFGDVFRAIAPMAGSGPLGASACKGQVAAWLAHGTSDGTVSFNSGVASRDHWLAANHCSSDTVPVGDCVAYQGCDAGYPVHWCEFSGGHTRPSFAPEAIWSFFEQF